MSTLETKANNQKNTEFYFIRHGKTDNHYGSSTIPLNKRGILQAETAKILTDKLDIKSICHSPITRAVETKDILFHDSDLPQFQIGNLAECNSKVWRTMTCNVDIECYITQTFIQQAITGINAAIVKPGPAIIVAHGGIHYAFCHYHQISEHSWFIDNCELVHFRLNDGQWRAQKITTSS